MALTDQYMRVNYTTPLSGHINYSQV